MNGRLTRFTVQLAVFVVLVGCAGPGREASGATATALPRLPEATPLAPGPVLVYERTGGLKAVNERWAVFADGAVETPSGARLQVDPEKVAALMNRMKAAGFFGLRAARGSPCADCYTYTLQAEWAGGSGGIRFDDTVVSAQPELAAVLDLVQSFLRSLPAGG